MTPRAAIRRPLIVKFEPRDVEPGDLESGDLEPAPAFRHEPGVGRPRLRDRERDGPQKPRFQGLSGGVGHADHDADGRVRVREMEVRGLESEEGDRTIMVLSRPADLSGTAFLSVLQGEGRRSQWMYLPAARRRRHGAPVDCGVQLSLGSR